jgi:hypothetical protein
MSKVPYTFTVIRYVHDRGAGEALNIGVVLYAPTVQFIGLEVEPRFERLSKAFGGFDGDAYRRTLRHLADAVERLQREWEHLPEIRHLPTNAGGLLRLIWPDTDLSFEPGPVLAGVAVEPLPQVVSELFGRMVTSQAPGRGEAERRTDEEIWAVYQQPFRAQKISHLLAPKVFKAPEFELKFDHAFQNTLWHVVQPVTMDFVKPESLQDKATRWLGNATALHGHPHLGRLYLLLGRPQLESHHDAYVKAKNLLHKMPVNHELVEEHDASSFAETLASFMKQHGVVPHNDQDE